MATENRKLTEAQIKRLLEDQSKTAAERQSILQQAESSRGLDAYAKSKGFPNFEALKVAEDSRQKTSQNLDANRLKALQTLADTGDEAAIAQLRKIGGLQTDAPAAGDSVNNALAQKKGLKPPVTGPSIGTTPPPTDYTGSLITPVAPSPTKGTASDFVAPKGSPTAPTVIPPQTRDSAWDDGKTFQSADERLAAMTNKTGAYAPIDANARVAAARAGAPVSPVGMDMGRDFVLPAMTNAQARATEVRYAPRVADPMYAGRGVPTPVQGSSRSLAATAPGYINGVQTDGVGSPAFAKSQQPPVPGYKPSQEDFSSAAGLVDATSPPAQSGGYNPLAQLGQLISGLVQPAVQRIGQQDTGPATANPLAVMLRRLGLQ